jgi:hypothetical protein
MHSQISNRIFIGGVISAVAVLGLLITLRADDDETRENGAEKHLFIWAGDQARTAPDFLAAVNFNQKSAEYGKVITRVPLPSPGASGNEPHHVGLSKDGRTLACGGLLSVLKGQNEIFFFAVTHPDVPKFLSSANPPLSANTDEFHEMPGGGFLVTMMGSANGSNPGRVAEFNGKLQLLAEHPANPPADGFNPHGISARPEMNLMVTSDFICPSSTLHAVPGDLMLRGSIRVWDLKRRSIVRSVKLPGSPGTIDVKLIPHDPQGRAFTAGMVDDKLYLIDTEHGTYEAVFDFATIAKSGWPQLMRMTRNGNRLFVSMNMAGKVAMLDTSDPRHPVLLKTLDLGAKAGRITSR